MKRKVKILGLIAMLVMSVFILNGCGNSTAEVGEEDSPISLVIIAGRHANANMYTEDMVKRAKSLIERSIVYSQDSSGHTAEAQVSVIVCDGDPTKVKVEVDGKNILKCTAGSRGKLQSEIDNMVSDIIDFLCSDDLRADDPEVDLLAAIGEAQKILNANPDSEHHIFILDTGVTTAGYLDMRAIDILAGECADIIDSIRNGIPDLDVNGSTYVTFLNLGNVAEPQGGLKSTQSEKRMVELWTSIIEAAGGILTSDIYYSASEGEAMYYYETPAEDDPGYEYVGTVHFAEEDSNGNVLPAGISIREQTGEEAAEKEIAYVLETADLGFKPDSAEFRDEAQAVQTINNISESLEEYVNNTDYKIYIVGSIAKTAPDSHSRTNRYSEARANAVARLLVQSYNVPEDRIVVIDAGTTQFPWRNANEFPNGSAKADPAEQQKNRVVAIIGENSADLVQCLKDENYIN